MNNSNKYRIEVPDSDTEEEFYNMNLPTKNRSSYKLKNPPQPTDSYYNFLKDNSSIDNTINKVLVKPNNDRKLKISEELEEKYKDMYPKLNPRPRQSKESTYKSPNFKKYDKSYQYDELDKERIKHNKTKKTNSISKQILPKDEDPDLVSLGSDIEYVSSSDDSDSDYSQKSRSINSKHNNNNWAIPRNKNNNNNNNKTLNSKDDYNIKYLNNKEVLSLRQNPNYPKNFHQERNEKIDKTNKEWDEYYLSLSTKVPYTKKSKKIVHGLPDPKGGKRKTRKIHKSKTRKNRGKKNHRKTHHK